jgi:signal transduction histidine kinase
MMLQKFMRWNFGSLSGSERIRDVEQFVCTMMDVTEHQKAEEEREAARRNFSVHSAPYGRAS